MTNLRKLGETMHKVGEAIGELTGTIQTAVIALNALGEVMTTPQVRRWFYENELGYKIPDFVWEVEETMRRTEGSGNGRIIRD